MMVKVREARISARAKVKPDCEQCRHHHDLHEKGADGKPFLCRCRLHNDRSHFLTKDGCEDFNQKTCVNG